MWNFNGENKISKLNILKYQWFQCREFVCEVRVILFVVVIVLLTRESILVQR